ncbi:MAG: acyl-CoA/acyl-ACP dehydrogenase [Acidimicrobiia bacterium]|nr:acyl-CoA/acyl-ACP dehydrogenase [Acidimicrobiia bacterium]
MDFTLTDEQEELRGLARQILTDRMTLGGLRAFDESTDWFDRDTWAEFAKANLLGVALPESVGGLGYGFLELCLILEEQGRAVAPMPLLHTLVSCAGTIAEFGNDEQRAGIAPIVSGESVVTAAFSELGTSAYEPMTSATPQGSEWRLEGKKVCVPMAHVCDRVLVPARVGDDIGMFLVKVDQPGVSLERQDVTNHEPQFVMHLDGATVEDSYRIGELAQGREILRYAVQRTIVGICAIVTGACQEALRITAQYTTERKQFDRAIGTFQAVGQRMADAYIDTQAIELTMLQAATKLAAGEDAGMEVATAKFWASEAGSRVGHAALHVHGGICIDLDYPIHRYFQWIKQLEFTLGSETEQLRDLGRLIAAG